MSGLVTVPRYSEQGSWSIYSFSCTSGSGKVTLFSNYYSFTAYTSLAPYFFTQDGFGDAMPPNITGVAVKMASIDTSMSAVREQILISVTDNLAGVQYCYIQVLFPDAGVYGYSGSTFTSGDLLDGVLSITVYLARYSQAGTYRVQLVDCYDTLGLVTSLTLSDLQRLGFAASFVQVSQGDALPPVLNSLSISPLTINTTSMSQQVMVTINATDDESGISQCWGAFTAPASGGSQTFYAYASYPGQVFPNETVVIHTTITIPQYSVPGVWNLTSLNCNDNVGHGISFTADTLYQQFSAFFSFNQVGRTDTSPPTLKSIQILTPVVNTTFSSATVSAALGFSDDLSGVSACSISMSQNATSNVLVLSMNIPSQLSNGTATQGFGQASGTLAQNSPNITWTVTSYVCQDIAGNRVSANVTTESFTNITLTNIGLVERQAPTITYVTFYPSVINTTASVVTVTVTINVTGLLISDLVADFSACLNASSSHNDLLISDDILGANSCTATFVPPINAPTSTPTFTAYISNRASGVPTNAVLTGAVTFSQYIPSGVYNLSSVQCSDTDGHITLLNAPDFFNVTNVSAVIQQGRGDIFPPVVVNFTILTPQVNTSLINQHVAIAIRVTDDLSGLSYCNVVFTTASGSNPINMYVSTSNLVSGTYTDGLYYASATINYATPQTLFNFTSITCTDNLQHTVTYDFPTLLSALNSTASALLINQTGPGDAQPPAVVSISSTPEVLFTNGTAAMTTLQIITSKAKLIVSL